MLMPSLPFYLEELDVGSEDDIARWNGAITTSQFIAVVIGNLIWGLVGDRLGSRRALQLALVGDTVFFALSSFMRSPVSLTVVRFLAGLSTPLTPALLYIFERANSPASAVKDLGQFVLAVNLAYCTGGTVVSVAYDEIDFLGVNPAGSGLCLVTLLFVSFLASEPLVAGSKPKPEGVRNALSPAAFLVHAARHLTL